MILGLVSFRGTPNSLQEVINFLLREARPPISITFRDMIFLLGEVIPMGLLALKGEIILVG